MLFVVALHLFLCCNSVMFLCWLSWNFETFVLMVRNYRLQMWVIYSEILVHFLFVRLTISVFQVHLSVPVCFNRLLELLFIVFVMLLMFLLMSMFDEFEFTPFLFIVRIVIGMLRAPCMPTNVESEGFIFDIINISMVFLLIIVVIVS